MRVEGALWGWGDGVCACIWRPEDNSGLTLSNLSDSFETVFFFLIGLEVPDYGKQTKQ